MQALVGSDQFIGGTHRAYLYTPGEGLAPRSATAAVQLYFVNKSDWMAGRIQQMSVATTARERLCRLMVGADPDDIAFLSSSSEGVNAVYDLIDWRAGDNVVLMTNDLEFPSVVLPAVKREQSGIELRVVGRHGWHVQESAIADAVDGRTRLVFVSHVSYRTGYRLDLRRLSSLLSGSDACLAVDATQSLGVVPVNADACDFLIATPCKWLLGPHGLGVFYWNRGRRPDLEPTRIGWFSVIDDLQFPYELKPNAERFELGGPNLLGIAALNAGLDVLTLVGIERLEVHALGLSDLACHHLDELGLPLMSPRDPDRRSGIVAWEDPDYLRTAAHLNDEGVVVTGSSGRIRAGFHLYNDTSDVDRLVSAMQRHSRHS
jgi:selenocysteine lyase/cysteine desulfurase